ncbi:universal stress protein [Endozoicomonas arenosclerae]|uniref:universal stress protein n=1 Tax=Endozoicomonas arenosclerae TaxID=1633495 RepID=UPI0007817F43|nr:universal stress protein [Endozoicomonas arenosclerae]
MSVSSNFKILLSFRSVEGGVNMHAFKTVMVAITRSHTSELELRQAFRLVADNNARLVLAFFDQSLEVMRRLQFIPLEGKLEAAMRKQLELDAEQVRQLAWEEGIEAQVQIVAGKPRQLIGGLIEEYGVDLVIKLADPSGALARNQLTGNDLALLRKCPVPVLMMACRDQLPDFTGRILVAIDVGDPDSDAVALNRSLLLHGHYLSSQENAELHVVSVWNLPVNKPALKMLGDEEIYDLQESTHQRYQQRLDKALADAGLDAASEGIKVHLLKGNAAREIQNLANEINVDLIVMGTLSRHAQGMLMGNTAENILNNIYCSILAVKPEGFVSPLA